MPGISCEPKINPVDGAQLIYIEAGAFCMASSDEDVTAILQRNPVWDARWFAHEKPQRTVTLPGYWIYQSPVTVAQFKAYCAATEWRMPAEPEWGWHDDHPMVNVSWEDASQYSTWANVQLPTEEHWEKAARGTDSRWWPWGNDYDATRCVNASNASSTQPVGQHPTGDSPYGVQDMAGNVWEWCVASQPGEYDRQVARNAQRRPSSMPSNRVLRGGSWLCSYDAYLRCAYRCFDCETHKGRGAYRRPSCGFRCIVSE
jgi:formylglycine-generating enzyme required for sulfatase activity